MGDNISIIAGIRNSIESSRLEVLNVEDPDSVASNGAALEKKFFVPWAALVELLSRGNIRAVLKECIEITHLYKIDELLDIISNGGGLRVFAILLVIQRPHLIKKLVEKLRLENHHLDSNLPFDPETLFSITEDAEASHQFADRQWEFIAPVFRKDQSYRSFCNRTVLPFTEQEELGRGAFGRIYKVTIPASHMVSEKQEFSKKNFQVVRKEIINFDQSACEQEAHILSLLRYIRHPNIINLLAAYKVNDSFNLLFPLADYDLSQFLANKRPNDFKPDNKLFRALFGLSSAVQTIHNYFAEEFDLRMVGCHHDLKPKNVLICDGTFKLADFGLSHMLIADGEDYHSKFEVCDPMYRAPECLISVDGRDENQIIGPASDIWSLGCIFAEISTHTIMIGPEYVKEFKKARKHTLGNATTRYFHCNGQPNKGVMDWLDGLHKRSETIHLRSLTQTTIDMLNIASGSRPKASEISRQLSFTSLSSLYHDVGQGFKKLLKGPNPELELQQQRFLLWGECSGMALNEAPGTYTDSRFLQLEELLESIQTELANISKFSNSPSFEPKSRILYTLRKLLEQLWGMETHEERRKLCSLLESWIVDMADTGSTTIKIGQQGAEAGHEKVSAQRIGVLSAMKQISFALTNTPTNPTLELDRSLIVDREDFGAHQIGKLNEASSQSFVLIESMQYNIAWENRYDQLVSHVRNLAEFRSSNDTATVLRLLRCIGYYHNPSANAFDLVYKFPSTSSTSPLNLYSLIRQTSPREKRPLLGSVFKLAYTLAFNLLQFHKGGWLHKGISSYNVIFFCDSANWDSAVTSPYIIGFNYSRPDTADAVTQGPPPYPEAVDYEHPDYAGSEETTPFNPVYDYYSLGLVLLEIGLWKPLGKITQEPLRNELSESSREVVKRRLKTQSPPEVRLRILENWVPLLGSYMGEAYRNAVASCIKGEFEGDALTIRRLFEEHVVSKIFEGLQLANEGLVLGTSL